MHLRDQLTHDLLCVLGEFIPPLGLPLVDGDQVLLKNLLCQHGLDVRDAGLGEEARLAVRAVAHHVDVRVVTLIVKGSVPTELAVGDLHRLRHIHGVIGEQLAPAGGVVVTQPCRVLPPQGDDGQPHHAGMLRHLIRYLGEHQRTVTSGEQTVRPQLLHTGTVGDVVHVVLTFRDCLVVVLDGAGDELGCVAPRRRGLVVRILEQLPAGREVP